MQQADEDIEREVAQQPGGMRAHIAVPRVSTVCNHFSASARRVRPGRNANNYELEHPRPHDVASPMSYCSRGFATGLGTPGEATSLSRLSRSIGER